MVAPSVWVLADDRAGNVNQALGVAEALGLPFEVKQIRYTGLAALPNFMRGASTLGLTDASVGQLSAPWPEVVIGAGRRVAPVSRWIKRMAGGRAFLVQIMFPGGYGAGAIGEFNLIAVPRHDSFSDILPTVLRITGAPHRVTPDRLDREAEAWRERFDGYPRPFISVLVGGATKNRPFGAREAADFADRLRRLQAEAGGTLLLTTSRRTPAEAVAVLERSLPQPMWLYKVGDTGENPYFGLLALADAVVVTGDSVSMCSEACATQGPVFIHAPPGMVAPKHARLHAELYRLGYARPFTGAFEDWSHPPLNAAREIALAVRQNLGLPLPG
ncbi:mitochondrial fission ELM1 family protein [Caenispirillum bisanense]|uniref:mitochondrial fission ELM1 family protein n=1 Tax=Caenispirillum bisanense TaxID=414052 RepID=UPI0031E32E45